MRADCVITGVILYDRWNDVAYNGDLFYLPDGMGVYICNCNEASAHTPDEGWQSQPGVKWVEPTDPDSFNRRGVWVWLVADTKHSLAALEYMGQ